MRHNSVIKRSIIQNFMAQKRIQLDLLGKNCLRCEFSDNGSTLIMSGMTS
jgi:hypothetical protein